MPKIKSSSRVKQVIVVRMDLQMSGGKLLAQVSHASMAPLTKRGFIDDAGFHNHSLINLEDWKTWVEGSFTKITLKATSEEQLRTLYEKAQHLGLTCELIVDAGHTEFTQPTPTCLSIGPAKTELINKVTGNLPTLKLRVEEITPNTAF